MTAAPSWKSVKKSPTSTHPGAAQSAEPDADERGAPDLEPLRDSRGWTPVHRGSFLEIGVQQLRLPNGVSCSLDMVLHPGAAAVVPIDTDRQVVLVRQYRYATGGWLLEVPAGKRDPGETPEACAHRELTEEVGLAAGTLTSLGPIWTSPGFTNEQIHLFLATDLTPATQTLDHDEVLEVVRMPLAEAIALAGSESMPDAKSALALLRAARAIP